MRQRAKRRKRSAITSKNRKTRLFQGDIESHAAKKLSIEEAFAKENNLMIPRARGRAKVPPFLEEKN
jgi:hypothetical protein